MIGHLLNWGLFGMLSVQVYVYYLAFPNDPLRNKALTYGVYLFEATQTFMLTQTAFHSFAAGFGNMLHFDEFGTIWFSVPIMDGIVAFVAQTFYAYRILILSGSKAVASFIVFLSVIQLGGAIATGVETKAAVLSSRYLGPKTYITMAFWSGGSALCDVIIAICMTFYLSRRNTGMKNTQLLIRKVIRLTIETGTLTAVVATLNLILALLPGHPTYYQTCAGTLGKLYSNSMLAVFNSRATIGSSKSSDELTAGVNFINSRWGTAETPAVPMDTYPLQVSVTQEQVTFPSVQDFDQDDKPIKA